MKTLLNQLPINYLQSLAEIVGVYPDGSGKSRAGHLNEKECIAVIIEYLEEEVKGNCHISLEQFKRFVQNQNIGIIYNAFEYLLTGVTEDTDL